MVARPKERLDNLWFWESTYIVWICFWFKAKSKRPITKIQKNKKLFEHTPLQSKVLVSHHFIPPTNGTDFVASKNLMMMMRQRETLNPIGRRISSQRKRVHGQPHFQSFPTFHIILYKVLTLGCELCMFVTWKTLLGLCTQ
jgi:hypothetical protein